MSFKNVLFFAVAVLMLSACNGAKFTSYNSKALSANVFGSADQPDGSDNVSGTITQPGMGSNSSGAVSQPSMGSNGSGAVSQPNKGSGAGGSISQMPTCSENGVVNQPSLGSALGSIKQTSSDCKTLLPSWASAAAPAPQDVVAANAASGILPAIKPVLVTGPWHSTGTTLVNSTNGVMAELLKCGSNVLTACSVVQTWDDAQSDITLAARLFNGQSFQLKTTNALTAGNYYVVILPAGPSTAKVPNYSNAGVAIAPMADSVANDMQGFTFSVDASGQVKAGSSSYNVLLNTTYINDQDLDSNPTLACTRSENQGSIDPLMIDFSGRGIQLSSQARGIDFDLQGNGQTERVSWPINAGNMFLVYDKTGVGQITGADFFGNTTPGPDGKIAADGFSALAKYDDNGDGSIDSNDVIFAKLRLWSDANRDGVVQRNELKSLSEMGVAAIDLATLQAHEKDIYGNSTSLRSVVHMVSGPARIASDVWFRPAP